MNDPVGAFEEVRDNFLLYVKTAFGTQFPSLETERDQLLRKPGVFCQQPWIEPLPRYESGKSIYELNSDDLPGFTGEEIQEFRELASCGLVGSYPLYTHQLTMLKKALLGKNLVVTAGTGSGKTESFLLPLFAYLVRESKGWEVPGSLPEHWADWWSAEDWMGSCRSSSNRLKRSYRIPQRGHENRDSAVRALVLYPMNALVEDQLTRLRRALDSEQARGWFKSNRKGNRIYFGRYNGNSPVPGHEQNEHDRPNRDKIEDLVRAMLEAENASEAAAQHAEDTHDDDVRFFFPQLDGGEMRSRWDMQDHPPDILITNYSMLSIMMMRDADEAIFRKTREWLKKEGSVFHLIIDELHLYRGTAGTEVAYLLKLLLLRLGITPNSPKLRILASSASLEPTDPKSLGFLTEFFGTAWTSGQIIPGSLKQIAIPEGVGIPYEPFVHLQEAHKQGNDQQVKNACLEISAALGHAQAGEDPYDGLRKALEADGTGVGARMLHACISEGQVRAVSLPSFGARIFGEGLSEEQANSASAGLLVARGLCDLNQKSSLPSFRFHWFFRNIEGLWACTMPGCECGSDDTEGRTPGKLFGNSRILCSRGEAPHRVLELLYCEQCGTIFFGGSRLTLTDNAGWELLTTEPDVEGIPDRQAARFIDRKNYGDFAIFWPKGKQKLHEDAEGTWSQQSLTGGPSRKCKWTPASLHTGSGQVLLEFQEPEVPNGPWVPGYIFHIPSASTQEEQQAFSALPSACPACGTTYARRLYRKSPVRGFRTGFSKVSQLLSKELFYLLPEGDFRKLVVFSDSREDAAAISNGIERSHYLDLVREAMYDELSNVVFGEGALLNDLRAHGELQSSKGIEFAKTNPAFLEKIKHDLEIASSEVPKELQGVWREMAEKQRGEAIAAVNSIDQRSLTRKVPLRVLFEGADDSAPGQLIQRFKTLGVNPAGCDVLYQEYHYDGSFDHHWTEFFDFSAQEKGFRTNLSPSAKERKENKLRPKVVYEICSVLFSRLYFGFESAGLGYACVDSSVETMQQIATTVGMSVEVFSDVCNGLYPGSRRPV